MEDNMYDEFGNYVGPEEESEEEPEAPFEDDLDAEGVPEAMADSPPPDAGAVILAEDKRYYPDAGDLYGPDTDVRVEDEDAQPLEKPIIEPAKDRMFDAPLRRAPGDAERERDRRFVKGLAAMPAAVRNLCLAGHIHHGKTTLVDYLLWSETPRLADSRIDEQSRGISIKCHPITAVLQTSRHKSHLLNLMDTPGHVDFSDEVTAAMRLCDGALVVVDAVEGVMSTTARVIRQAARERLPIVLVINKIDRLIMELKLPPGDAYHKLRHTIEEVNTVIAECVPDGSHPKLSPEMGNVGSTLPIIVHPSFPPLLMTSLPPARLEIEGFIKRLWGDIYYNSQRNRFSKTAGSDPDKPPDRRSFVHFILEPLYKMHAMAVGEDPKGKHFQDMLAEMGVRLTRDQLGTDARPLAQAVLSQFFDSPVGLVDMVVTHLPDPVSAAGNKALPRLRPVQTDTTRSMMDCDPDPQGTLVMHVTKLFHKPDASSFDAYARVMCGTVRVGQQVKVLGEGYTPEDEEDMAHATVSGLFIPLGRARHAMKKVRAGMCVMVEGIDGPILKTATITGLDVTACIFRPLAFNTLPMVKVAVEPLHPAELPKMVDALRNVNKTYPISHTKVEESGEHVVMGTGEMYMDCVLHDMRRMFGDIEVSDPVTTFCETVTEQSSLKCFAETPNKRNKVTMTCEPLDKGLAEDIERGSLSLDMPRSRFSGFLVEKYGWERYMAEHVWAFGPSSSGPNVLVDDTLTKPGEQAEKFALLSSVRDGIVQGFQWGSREGPLCDEPMRNVRFNLLDTTIAPEPIYRGAGQIIPTARRVSYSAFLLATPHIMEPVYFVEIQTPVDCISSIYTVLAKRRGNVTQDLPKAGSPLYTVNAFVPVMDSFGLETDIRSHTQGQAFCQSTFDHWRVVSGNPLDKNIVLRPLEPAPATSLARDFMVKTRRRKGMSEDVSINKYFDDPMLLELVRQDVDLQGF